MSVSFTSGTIEEAYLETLNKMGVRSEPCTKAKLLKGVGKGQSLLWQHASKYYTERLFLVDLYKGRCNLLCSKGHLYVYLGVNVVDDKMMILFVCI